MQPVPPAEPQAREAQPRLPPPRLCGQRRHKLSAQVPVSNAWEATAVVRRPVASPQAVAPLHDATVQKAQGFGLLDYEFELLSVEKQWG